MRSTGPEETHIVRVKYQFSEPAKAELELVFALELPIDCDGNDATAIRCCQTGDVFEVRIADLLPALSESTRFRIRMFCSRPQPRTSMRYLPALPDRAVMLVTGDA